MSDQPYELIAGPLVYVLRDHSPLYGGTDNPTVVGVFVSVKGAKDLVTEKDVTAVWNPALLKSDMNREGAFLEGMSFNKLRHGYRWTIEAMGLHP